jgi:type II secretory pathway pseudopilin PulG
MIGRLAVDERGITVVEGVVAAMILIIAALGVLQTFDAAARNNFRAEESQVVVNRLQAELEEIRALPFAEVAMDSAPGSLSDTNDPRWRVSGSEYALGRQGTNLQPMVIDAAQGGVSATPELFTVGDISGTIHKFVTWAPDPNCPDANGCEDLKRVVVAATIDEAPISFEHTYQEVQGDVVNPDAVPPDNVNPPPPGGGEEGGVLWLTDTACSETTRQPPTGDHLTHNTRGECGDGLQTGATAGAPDFLVTEPFDCELPACDPAAQPLYDFATDVEPVENPDQDKGLLLQTPSAGGCVLVGTLLDLPDLESDRHLKLHNWLSPPVPAGEQLSLDGGATLELWTRTLNGASHEGEICVYLFIRQLDLNGDPVDTPFANSASPPDKFFRYSTPTWPTDWEEVAVSMDFPAVQLGPTDQLGVAITVEKNGTLPGQALQFIYDHPSFESRLVVETEGALPF